MTTAYAEFQGRSHASDVVTRVREALGRWLAYRRTVSELQALSNHSLADIGYSRGELRAIARREIYAN